MHVCINTCTHIQEMKKQAIFIQDNLGCKGNSSFSVAMGK